GPFNSLYVSPSGNAHLRFAGEIACDMRRLASAAGVVLALAVLGWLCRSRGDELQRALALVPAGSLFALTALHLFPLAAPSSAWGWEGWRRARAAVNDRTLPRKAVHGANAGAFVAGAIESHSALPVRALLLRRWAGEDAPRTDQILLSDAPIFLLEVCATAVVL